MATKRGTTENRETILLEFVPFLFPTRKKRGNDHISFYSIRLVKVVSCPLWVIRYGSVMKPTFGTPISKMGASEQVKKSEMETTPLQTLSPTDLSCPPIIFHQIFQWKAERIGGLVCFFSERHVSFPTLNALRVFFFSLYELKYVKPRRIKLDLRKREVCSRARGKYNLEGRIAMEEEKLAVLRLSEDQRRWK